MTAGLVGPVWIQASVCDWCSPPSPPELWRWPLNIGNDGSPAISGWACGLSEPHKIAAFRQSSRYPFPSFDGAQVRPEPGLCIASNNTGPLPLMTLAEVALLAGTRPLSGSHRLCAGVTVRANRFPTLCRHEVEI